MTTETTTSYKFGYARVSTVDQNEGLQRDALNAAGCDRIFLDKASGKDAQRPGLDAMLDQARAGDTVVVWRLDRLGRSLRHLLETIESLEKRRINFVSLTEHLDTSSAGGRLMLHLFAAIAEFKRSLLRERTQAGLAAARARGRVGGRPTVWTAAKLQTARSMYDSREHDVATIARVLGVSRASVYRALAATKPQTAA